MNKEYDLERFKKVHEFDYENALREIRNGRKESHWMWYIFPQLKGLGSSYTAEYYGIEDVDEARLFLEDDYLGKHLLEITGVLLELESDNSVEIFGYPDCLKLKSCMTLFNRVSESDVFKRVLDKYYDGIEDEETLKLLSRGL